MRAFPVPFDLCEEEKSFGGILSLRQVVYLVGGIILACVFGLMKISIFAKIPLTALAVIFALALAFYKINDEDFDKRLYYFVKFKLRKKRFSLTEGGE